MAKLGQCHPRPGPPTQCHCHHHYCHCLLVHRRKLSRHLRKEILIEKQTGSPVWCAFVTALYTYKNDLDEILIFLS